MHLQFLVVFINIMKTENMFTFAIWILPDIDLAKLVKALQILVKNFAVKSFQNWRIILWRGAPLTLHQE